MLCNLKRLADPIRFERTTFAFGGQRSIQLSYGSIVRSYTDIPGKPQPSHFMATYEPDQLAAPASGC